MMENSNGNGNDVNGWLVGGAVVGFLVAAVAILVTVFAGWQWFGSDVGSLIGVVWTNLTAVIALLAFAVRNTPSFGDGCRNRAACVAASCTGASLTALLFRGVYPLSSNQPMVAGNWTSVVFMGLLVVCLVLLWLCKRVKDKRNTPGQEKSSD